MQHPIQTLTTVDTLLITACNTHLNCFDLSTSTLISSSTPHSSLIRSLACFTEPTSSNRYLISTGEDKQLIVSKLPSLEIVSQRELVKRANALQVTQQGEIVVGDKFGDVYTFPLHPPSPPPSSTATEPSTTTTTTTTTTSSKKSQPEYLPILGHVSMLNTLSLIPSTNDNGRTYIATGDRDEHVRISRFPLGHVIQGFLFGSKAFVSSLLYIPQQQQSGGEDGLLLSAGGDSTIQIFKLNLKDGNGSGSNPVGELIGQYEIESLLLDHIKVAPVLPDPVPAGRKKDKKGKNKSNTTKEQEDEAETAVVQQAAEEEGEEKKELKTGLAVIKMLQIGTQRDQGGILVLAAGSTALLYIPFSSLLSPSSSERSHSILSLPHPILDFTPLPIPTSSTSATEFLVSLDVTRSTSSSPTSTSPSPSSSLVRVSLSQSTHELTLLPSTSSSTRIDQLLLESTRLEIQTQPSISSLYPVLMMLHHPGDESDFLEGGLLEGNPGDGKPKGGVRAQVSSSSKKRTSSERQDGETGQQGGDGDNREVGGEGGEQPRKSGKRAVGRAETLRRWEEAKKKLEQGKGVESLSVGEKQAKEEMESEQQK
ncbi:hypothetical protein JCM3765_003968 [Sporobolomyces pararoseus]